MEGELQNKKNAAYSDGCINNKHLTLNVDGLIGYLTQRIKASGVYCGSAPIYTSLRCAYDIESQYGS